MFCASTSANSSSRETSREEVKNGATYLGPEIVKKLGLLQPRVSLYLVDSRHDFGGLQDLFRLPHGEITDSNAPHFPDADQPLHRCPGVFDGDILMLKHVGIWVFGEQLVSVLGKRNGPVDLDATK